LQIHSPAIEALEVGEAAGGVGGITVGEAVGAQEIWGWSLVNISSTYDDQGFGAAKKIAEQVIASAYGYNEENRKGRNVLFKPTLAYGANTFRLTSEGALCYFVGGCPTTYPEDTGFALKHWREENVRNAGIMLIEGGLAITMGNVILTKDDGGSISVDKTWGFQKYDTGDVKIVLHHSSTPFKPDDVDPPKVPVIVKITAKQLCSKAITVKEVLDAQQAWGQALVNISKICDGQGQAAAKAEAERVIDSAYGYGVYGQVLFKPTLAYGSQTFRLTRAGALAYFVGGDPNFPTDTGFACKRWTGWKVKNAGVRMRGTTAITMGIVELTNKDGEVTAVDKTWGFVKGKDGKLRIILHHSSLPYIPA